MSKAIPSNSTAAVRQHFGLTQAELGRLLGVTAGQVAEAGRRGLSSRVSLKLARLTLLLSPEAGGVGPGRSRRSLA